MSNPGPGPSLPVSYVVTASVNLGVVDAETGVTTVVLSQALGANVSTPANAYIDVNYIDPTYYANE